MQDTEIDAENLVPRLRAIAQANNQVVFVRGDKASPMVRCWHYGTDTVSGVERSACCGIARTVKV